MNNRGYYCKIMGNETSTKVGEYNKTLNIMNKSCTSPIDNGFNLVRIHANATSRNDITKKIHFVLIEFTFL